MNEIARRCEYSLISTNLAIWSHDEWDDEIQLAVEKPLLGDFLITLGQPREFCNYLRCNTIEIVLIFKLKLGGDVETFCFYVGFGCIIIYLKEALPTSVFLFQSCGS